MGVTPVQFVRLSAWSRLRKNSGAVAGLTVITIAFCTAVLAYVLAPDHSPFANRMTVEIGGQRPGYTQLFLLIRKVAEVRTPSSGWTRWAIGTPDSCQYLPITRYIVRGDSLDVLKYVDEDITEPLSFSLERIDPLGVPLDRYLYRERFWLGTDRFGRDVLSRLIIGTRVSFSVGLIAVAISLSIGVSLGSLGGYFRGWLDEGIVWFMNVVWSIPTLLLVFAITLALGKGFWEVFIAVGLTLWVNVARILRGQVMTVRELEYVEAGKALGFRDVRIILRHILPNVMGPVLVVAASNFATAIIIEAGLSFLGVGVQPPEPSWGLMIKENYSFIITHNPMLALVPGIAIMVLVLAFNLLGNGLRDALDVRKP
jgi:ABC-type dipeptide/oligopeptide/nickel transport system permease subunit